MAIPLCFKRPFLAAAALAFTLAPASAQTHIDRYYEAVFFDSGGKTYIGTNPSDLTLEMQGARVKGDPDHTPPGRPSGQTGGSFISDIRAGTGLNSNLYIDVYSLFGITYNPGGPQLSIADIANISYTTRLDADDRLPANHLTWALRLTTGIRGQSNPWYNQQFQLNPLHSSTGSWETWNLNSGSSVTILDNSGTPSSPNSWSYVTGNYGANDLMYLSFYLGNTSVQNNIFHDLGSVTITLANGDSATVHFTAVPEASTVALLLSGTGALMLLRRRRLYHRK